MKIYNSFWICIFGVISSYTSVLAQQNDSIQKLDQVIVTSLKRSVPFLESTSSIGAIKNEYLQLNHPERILESVNLIPGSKMEERTPGSYRISLRGSTIRSPFGIRNVKIYLDDFILTDATGNSYLNLLNPQLIHSIDVLKGPQGSEIGSETGGVLFLNTTKSENINLNILGGSYNMFSQSFNVSKKLGKHFLQINQSHYQTNSYREQSAVNKNTFFIKDTWSYHKKATLNATLLYTNLHYETPGGLTLQQMQQNRKQARLATANLPSAVSQNTGIYNKTFLGGVSHLFKISENWSQFTLLQGSFTDFKNPFISNYEVRDEKNFQGRAFVQYQKQLDNIRLETRAGLEAGSNETEIKNYDNLNGNISNPQKFDNIKTQSAFYYVTQKINLRNTFIVDASLSLNSLAYQWETTYPNFEAGTINFKNKWLPSLGALYKIQPDFVFRAKVAKGSSSPTTEEVRSSNQIIATNLQAEYGWNTEIGLRKRLGPLFLETTIFNFNLEDAIVRKQDVNGNDYYINSGNTKQFGTEFLLETNNFKFTNKYLNNLKLMFSGTYYDFKYANYNILDNDFSGNRIPGTSKWAFQSVISLRILNRLQVNYSNYYNSNQFLNDANTVKEKGFIVGNIKLNTAFNIQKQKINLVAGLHNIYNTKYSAGYDLNAFGNRFYNPAASPNFYLGTQIYF